MNSAIAKPGAEPHFSSQASLPLDSIFHPQSNVNTQQSFSHNSQASLSETQKDPPEVNFSIGSGHNEPSSSPNNPLLLTNTLASVRESIGNSPTRQRSYHKEAKLYYIRKLGFFIFTVISSLLIWAFLNGFVTFDAPFVVVYVYLAYLGLESFVRSAYFQTKEDKKREDILIFFGAIAAFIYVGSLHLKLVNNPTQYMTVLGAVPVIISPACYLKFSMTSEEKKLRKFVICLFFAIQVFLINLKLEGILTTNWKLIFGPLWLFFGGLSLHFVAYGLLFAFSLPVLFKRSNDPNEETDHKLYSFGVFWTTLYYSISVAIFATLFGFVQKWSVGKGIRRDNGDENILNGSIAGMIISSLLILITAIGFKFLIKYQQMIGYSQGVVQSAEMLSAFSSKTKSPVIEFKAEKVEAYFMMQSATYFLPYKLNKNEEMMPINHESLEVRSHNSEVKETGAQYQDDGIVRKRLISSLNNLDNKEEETMWMANSQKRGKYEEDKLCYLCFRDEPNVVLGNCGHGGVCYGCITAVVQRKNECMQCRAKVKEIYKVVDGSKKSGDIVKASEMIKVIELE